MALNSSKTGTPILSVEIAGRKLNLWLDSGASISVLSSAVARLCRIESILNQSGSIRSASDYQVRFKGAIVPEMKIGNLIIHDLPVVIVNRFDLRIRQASRVKLKIDGIIGWDLIRYLDLVIDRKNRLIIIRKPEIDTQFLATDRNLFWLGYPIISLSSREGLPLHFGLDTGSTSTKLTDNIHHKIDLKSNKRILKVGSAGGFNEISVRVFPDFSLILCGKMIHYPNIYSHPLHFAAFVRMDGVFGNDLLEKGRVRIDFLNGRFEFMPY